MPTLHTVARPARGSYVVPDDTLVQVGPATDGGTSEGKPVKRRDLYVNGTHVGTVEQRATRTTRTVTGHRYTAPASTPVRWFGEPLVRPVRESSGWRTRSTGVETMAAAAYRLAETYLNRSED